MAGGSNKRLERLKQKFANMTIEEKLAFWERLEDMKTLGMIAFDAYNLSRGGVNHMGNRTPPWDDLGEEIQDAWECAAEAVAGECGSSGDTTGGE